MVKSLKIVNAETGEEIEITADGANGYVIDEIDWDEPVVDFISYKIPNQIGGTLKGCSVGTRKPVISGYIVSNLSGVNTVGMGWDEYLRAQEEEINDRKEKLNKLFSIYEDVVIKVGDFNLLARPALPPKYSVKEQENNEVLCYFKLEFVCFNALFYSGNKNIVLVETAKKFKFPLVIPPEKFVFGEVSKIHTTTIENNGDVPVGCKITIGAVGGTIENPRIYNVKTGEFIEVENVTLYDGDYITIITKKGEENITKHVSGDSEEQSLLANLKTGSSFFQIEKGNNYYGCWVSLDYMNYINVSIEFSEQYFNLKEM